MLDGYNLDKFEFFNNFVPIYESDMLKNVEKYRDGAKLGPRDLKKRDGHHGNLYHEYWADVILDEARRKGMLKRLKK